jgi:hypothetical protein
VAADKAPMTTLIGTAIVPSLVPKA